MKILKCSYCQLKLKSNYIYVERKRITVGQFCPLCCRQFQFTDKFREYQDQLTKEKRERSKLKPKLTRQRKACPYCIEKGIVNRSRWTMRKIPKKQDETQHWKCTCRKCGKDWFTNSGDEYYYIDKNLPKPSELIGAPVGL